MNNSTKEIQGNDANAMLGAVRYHSHEALMVNNLFEKYFGIKFQSFWIGWVSGFSNEILIDIGKFDDYLLEKYNYSGSMSEFILKRFGEEAHEFLNRLI
ncbi:MULTISPECIES: hypothetical protein [Weeksella]|nr:MULTISPECIES: hypothetical protein [Weeksella]MDK7376148.1 hypothetical protein [Weeksella virosa]OFM84549.1 hypothetical protein HMPREF2660_08545 [Weeksella sp. HMSC059D05]